MNLKTAKFLRILYLILSIIFTAITFVGATFVIVNNGRFNAGYACVPMLFGIIFNILFQSSNKKIKEPILKNKFILPICILLIFGILIGFLYSNRNMLIIPNRDIQVYDNQGNLIYDFSKN